MNTDIIGPLKRLSLFYGGVGFYVNTALMTFSISVFTFCLMFFGIAGHTPHEIGTLGSSLAVEWVIQMGFAFALPLIAGPCVGFFFFCFVVALLSGSRCCARSPPLPFCCCCCEVVPIERITQPD